MFIIATISKNSYPKEKVREVLENGARVLRYNFSHGTPDEMAGRIGIAKEAIAELGLIGQVAILADLPGNKMRLGMFPGGEYPVTLGQEVTFKSSADSPDPEAFIPVDFFDIGAFVEPGQIISLGDGEVAFEVTRIIDNESLTARALNTRHIPALKGFNIGRAIDELDHFTPQTLEHIKHVSKLLPEWVAFTFVRSAHDIQKGRDLLAPYLTSSWNPKIVAKVETAIGIKNIEEIAASVDIVLVARGDLGLTMPIEQLGVSQKIITAAVKRAGKTLVISTQILDSLLSYYTPARAEVLDLTNIVLDGADGIMLAKETGISQTPGRSVAMAKRIIDTVEEYVRQNQKNQSRRI
jgi:pyruvate kinase